MVYTKKQEYPSGDESFYFHGRGFTWNEDKHEEGSGVAQRTHYFEEDIM